MATESTAKTLEKRHDSDFKEAVNRPKCSKVHPLYTCADVKKLSATKRLELVKRNGSASVFLNRLVTL